MMNTEGNAKDNSAFSTHHSSFNTPAIRFKGFGGEWVEIKLDSIFNKIRNAFVGTATPYYVTSGNFYLESNNVKNGKINRKSEVFINDEFYKKQSDKWLKTGDIVMVQSGHVGHTAVIPPELNNIAAHALIMFTEPKEKIAPHFFNCHFQTVKAKKELAEITTGNTIKHILSSEMKEYKILLPIEKEQTQIGNFFQQLDRLIAQHQQKHDKLLTVKKALLEKMFPRGNDELRMMNAESNTEGNSSFNTPAIRFKGFSEAWEEKALGDVAQIVMGQSPNGENYTDNPQDNILVQGNADMKNGQVVPRIWTTQITKRAEVGDLIFSVRAPVGEVGKTFYDVVIGRGVAAIKGNEFVFQSLKKMNDDGYWSKLSAGSTFDSINSNDLSNARISITEPKEQTKIGKLFQQLDTLINQQQSQLTKLNNIKQAMLAKMFA